MAGAAVSSLPARLLKTLGEVERRLGLARPACMGPSPSPSPSLPPTLLPLALP